MNDVLKRAAREGIISDDQRRVLVKLYGDRPVIRKVAPNRRSARLEEVYALMQKAGGEGESAYAHIWQEIPTEILNACEVLRGKNNVLEIKIRSMIEGNMITFAQGSALLAAYANAEALMKEENRIFQEQIRLYQEQVRAKEEKARRAREESERIRRSFMQ